MPICLGECDHSPQCQNPLEEIGLDQRLALLEEAIQRLQGERDKLLQVKGTLVNLVNNVQ